MTAAVCEACGTTRSGKPGSSGVACTTSSGHSVFYARCPSCGLLCMEPFPDSATIASFYTEAYYGLGATKFALGLDHIRSFFLSRRAKWVMTRLGHAPRAALDIGCGDGRFLRAMQRLGAEAHGTELEGPALKRARRVEGARVHAGELTNALYAGQTFDVITLWHVAEHLAHPQATLRLCRQLLADDGVLVIEVPNVNSWHSRFAGSGAFNLDPPRHLYQFTSESLRHLLQSAGFEVVMEETGSWEMGPMGVVQGLLNKVIRPRDLFYDMLRTRNACPGTWTGKVASVVLAALLVPLAMVVTAAESAAGRGAVLRMVSRGT